MTDNTLNTNTARRGRWPTPFPEPAEDADLRLTIGQGAMLGAALALILSLPALIGWL